MVHRTQDHWRKWTDSLLLAIAACLITVVWAGSAQGGTASDSIIVYQSPRPDAAHVSPATTIALRFSQLSGLQLDNIVFSVTGNLSGTHNGRTIVARDNNTLIFKPDKPFFAGETVSVTISDATQSRLFGARGLDDFKFEIAASIPDSDYLEWQHSDEQPVKQVADSLPPHDYRTAPPQIPPFGVTRLPGMLAYGYIFVGAYNYYPPRDIPGYLLILDDNAELVYYRNIEDLPILIDFKKQANGLLTYYVPAPGYNRFYALNSKYQIVDEYRVGNGYPTDHHDLQVLGNGNALMLIHEARVIDLSELFPGGKKDATVIGCVVQEVDQDNNVVFEWRSWDYFDILDTNRPLDEYPIRYTHCNSIEKDYDGNLLLSSKNLDEITKINRQTGAIIWRMGGRKNQFTFINDPGFSVQHDVRRLANGHITLYDNASRDLQTASRGVEYRVDEINKTVVRVAEYQNSPQTYGYFMGNMQRLKNGNTLIGWGTENAPILTEFDQYGNKILEFYSNFPVGTYRAFRFAWQGFPNWPPILVGESNGRIVNLYFSWNGSTETIAYRVFGGKQQFQLLGTVPRSGFETTFAYEVAQDGLWHFLVKPVDKNGAEGPPSNIVTVAPGGTTHYLALIAGR